MQLHLRFLWYSAAPHEDALWGEAFSVQPMQQSIQGQEKPDETLKNPHDLDFIVNLTIETTEITG